MVRVAQGILGALALVGLVTFVAYADPPLTVLALVQYPSRYDGKVVTVVGTIAGYRDRVSDSGHPYTVFRLTEGGTSVTVFTWNQYPFGNGDKVRVTGTFVRARSVGTVTFDNEIQAHRIEAAP
jgi:hypothetical protein